MSWEHPYLDAETQGFIKERLVKTGHLELPFGEPQPLPAEVTAELPEVKPDQPLPLSLVNDLAQMPLEEPAMVSAIESYKHFMVLNLEPLIAKHHPERRSAAPKIDGDIGPAVLELFSQPRCGMPDYDAAYADEAVGSGQWRSCHNIGSFHAAIVKVTNSPPAHLKRPYKDGTVWDEVKRRVRNCYAEIGLRFWFSDDADVPDGQHQTELSFVGRSGGWIGLALIGQGQQCSSDPIWLRLLETYLQSSAITEKYLTYWANLVIHEIAHNTGSGHTSGGILNPSILAVANTWIGDPAESRMKGWFGGEPVPLGDPDPPPPGPFPGGWTGQIKNATTEQVIKLFGVPG